MQNKISHKIDNLSKNKTFTKLLLMLACWFYISLDLAILISHSVAFKFMSLFMCFFAQLYFILSQLFVPIKINRISKDLWLSHFHFSFACYFQHAYILFNWIELAWGALNASFNEHWNLPVCNLFCYRFLVTCLSLSLLLVYSLIQ